MTSSPRLQTVDAPREPVTGRLDEGWELSVVEPGAAPHTWVPATVPGTAAGALRDAGNELPPDLDALECSFRTAFAWPPAREGERLLLALGGIATVAEVFLNGLQILRSESMFLAHEIDVSSVIAAENELVIRCTPLRPGLEAARRPRARWRTNIAPANLRFIRTTLLGRCPGFAAGPAVVGPWRPVSLRREGQASLDQLVLRPRLEGDDGILALRFRGNAAAVQIAVPAFDVQSEVQLVDGRGTAEIRLPDVSRWWPHTHGAPQLYEVRIHVDGAPAVTRMIGFRSLEPGPAYDVETGPLALAVNGVAIFARGTVWTPPDFTRFATDRPTLRRALARIRDAGMNMVRVPGIGAYESADFHDLCDELGLLVWQDFMFANFDYPFADEDFHELAVREVKQELSALVGRPSLAVLCGNSECEQQAAMLGVDPSVAREPFFRELLPQLLAEAGADAVYIPSAPSGGALPFRFESGVSNYFGAGAYRRPLAETRTANVGFASECLAIANVPESETLEEAGLDTAPVHHPRWKAGVPRDAGAPWDFDDVRDWYLRELFQVDPDELRRTDPSLYLDLSRETSGELMAEVLGEWRRGGSPCGGALVLWHHDIAIGAGWGLVDALGRSKAPLHHLRRALAPLAVWSTNEGLAGLRIHLANDGPTPFAGRLRVALCRGELRVDGAAVSVDLPPHSSDEMDLEALLGRFVDASWAYRFGPLRHDVCVASLEDQDGRLRLQCFRFTDGPPTARDTREQLGLVATADRVSETCVRVSVSATRLVYGVRIHAPGWEPDDNAFSVEPGGSRDVNVRTDRPEGAFAGTVTAVNLDGRVPVQP